MKFDQAKALAKAEFPEFVVEQGPAATDGRPTLMVRRWKDGEPLLLTLPPDQPPAIEPTTENPIVPPPLWTPDDQRHVMLERLKTVLQYRPAKPEPEPRDVRAKSEPVRSREIPPEEREPSLPELKRRAQANEEAAMLRAMSQPALPPEGAGFVTVGKGSADEEK